MTHRLDFGNEKVRKFHEYRIKEDKTFGWQMFSLAAFWLILFVLNIFWYIPTSFLFACVFFSFWFVLWFINYETQNTHNRIDMEIDVLETNVREDIERLQKKIDKSS